MPDRSDFLGELTWRGLVQEQSEGLAPRLSRGRISAYVGFDPTAPSLHVGHLVPIFALLHLQRTGTGRPYAVVGGGTGMIGDPSGKSAERVLLDETTLAVNVAAIAGQLERFLDFEAGTVSATLVDNRDWLGRYGLLEFLRDIGKHFSMGYMLSKESVQLRLQAGVSFTEFSYMTLQAADFLHLYREHGVELQMGGADQWGNITAGLELIRRVEGPRSEDEPRAFGLSCPLLTMASGAKFGKTEAGAVWLAPQLTSPFAFYQYWVNQDDRDVGILLRRLTTMPRYEITALEAEQRMQPGLRRAQKALARDLTARVHGQEEADRQARVAAVAFTSEPIRDPSVLGVLYEELDHFDFDDADLGGDAVTLGVSSGLYGSRSDARRAIQQGGFSINDRKVTDPAESVPEPIADRFLILRAGKKSLRVGRRRDGAQVDDA